MLPLAYSWSETLAPASALSTEITGGLHTPSAEHSLEAGQSLLRTHSTDDASRHTPRQLPSTPPHSVSRLQGRPDSEQLCPRQA